MTHISNSLPVEIGVLAIMPAVIVLLGLIFLVAALCALVIHALKRRTDIKFGVIGISNERRTVALLCALQAAHQAKADAQLEAEYDDRTAQNRMRRERRLRLVSSRELDGFEMPRFLRRQAN